MSAYDFLGDDPLKGAVRADDDDPLRGAVRAEDEDIPRGAATGPRRPVLAQMVQATGKPTKYGFKVSEEADINVGNTRGRFVIREDGAIWNGQKWVDPDTGQDAGAAPQKTMPDEWDQGGDAYSGTNVIGRRVRPEDAYLASKGVDMNKQLGYQGAPEFLKDAASRQMAKMLRARENPMASLGREILNHPTSFISPGTIVRLLREPFTDEPLGVEAVLPDPNVGRVAQGLGNIAVGPAQGLNTMFGSQDSSRLANEAALGYSKFFDENVNPSLSGQLIGEALPFLATGGGSAAATAPTRLSKFLRYVKNVGGGTVGGALQVDPDAVTQEQARQSMGERATMGGGLTAVIPPVAKLVGKGFGAAADSRAGVYLAQKAEGTPLEFLLGKTEYKPGMQAVTQRMKDLKKIGVNPSIGDITGDPGIRADEDFFRATNEAMRDFRLGQNRGLSGLAKAAKKRVSDEAASLDWDNIDEISEAAKLRGERGNQARKILEQMEGRDGGADIIPMREVPGGVESISARGELLRKKLRADRRFDRIERDAASLGRAQNEAVSLKKTAKEILDNLRDDTGDTASVKNYVKNIVAGLEKATTPRSTPTRAKLLSAIGAPAESVPGPAQDITFSGLRKLRSEINKKIQSLKGSSVAPDETAIVELGRLGKSVEDAMDGFLSRMAQNPNNTTAKRLSADYKTAQKLYKEAVAPYKDTDFGRKLSDASPKGIVDLFANADVADQQRFMKLMGEKGRAAVRDRLISGALGAGDVPRAGIKGVDFDPNKAAAKLWDLLGKGNKKHAEAVLGPKLSGAMEGLHNVLVTMGRAADTSAIPQAPIAQSVYPTRTSLLHRAGMWLQDKITGGPTLEGFTNPRSYLLLQRARKAKPGSREMWGLIALLTDEMDSEPPKPRERRNSSPR